jgi:arylsulfatase A-like enzyme
VSERVCGFQDILPTLAEAAGATTPERLDGLSFLPTLLTGKQEKGHESLYWEHYAGARQGAFVQAVRMGNWKAVQPKPGAAFELYDLSKDVGETRNLAGDHPEVVQRVRDIVAKAHTPPRDHPPDPKPPTIKDYVR